MTSHQLVVDSAGHAGEIRRFNRYVIAGPGPHDCAVFVGAIGDDGYGRFWLGRPGGPKVVRAQRFAVAAVHGVMPAGLVAMHECDNPLCVRVGARHVVIGTQSDNLRTNHSQQSCGIKQAGHDRGMAQGDGSKNRDQKSGTEQTAETDRAKRRCKAPRGRQHRDSTIRRQRSARTPNGRVSG